MYRNVNAHFTSPTPLKTKNKLVSHTGNTTWAANPSIRPVRHSFWLCGVEARHYYKYKPMRQMQPTLASTSETIRIAIDIVPSAQFNMRAARYYGKEDIRVETDVAEPTVKPGQVKVSTATEQPALTSQALTVIRSSLLM